jgi:ABC-type branched-subunit amino acid transport system ATPase component
LEARGLTKSFGGVRAVAGVDFSVDAGQILGVAGPNGSGKSTLFNIVTRIPFAADSGEVTLGGQRIENLQAFAIARLGLARTFQRESVFPALSAVDNVLLAAEGCGVEAPVRAAERALDEVEFPGHLHNLRAGGLPVFLRKLVMIASALVMRPRVLLLDEPAASLAPPEIARIRDLILRLKQQGAAIVLIEHVLPLLTAVSDRLMVMEQGGVIASGAPDHVIADPAVIEAYLGKSR